jgi:ankyrin repeat protein
MKTYNQFINESVRHLMTGKSKEEIRKSLDKLSPKEKLDRDEEWNIYTKEEVNELLYQLNTDDRLKYGVYKQNIDVIKSAVKNASNSAKSNSIGTAAANNFIDITKLLLDNGTDPDAMMNSPLLVTVQYGFDDLVKMLLDYGADVHKHEDYLLRHLMNNHKITDEKRYIIMKLLLDAGANPNTILNDEMYDDVDDEIYDLLKKYIKK